MELSEMEVVLKEDFFKLNQISKELDLRCEKIMRATPSLLKALKKQQENDQQMEELQQQNIDLQQQNLYLEQKVENLKQLLARELLTEQEVQKNLQLEEEQMEEMVIRGSLKVILNYSGQRLFSAKKVEDMRSQAMSAKTIVPVRKDASNIIKLQQLYNNNIKKDE